MELQKKFGLIGFPLGHSASPFIHGEIFRKTLKNSLVHDYGLYEIKPDELSAKYEFLASLEGFNVTIPLKVHISDYCEQLDSSADCGAVNCVKGKVGYNTDVYGFERSIAALGASLSSRVCLLGYGGAGKMAAHTIRKCGGVLTVAEINPESCTDDSVNLVGIGDLKGEFDLIINATPVGMSPNVDAAPIDFSSVKAEFALDLIYNPLKTKFLRLAESSGAKASNGLAMLVWQAVKSHEIWYGGAVSDDDVAEIIAMTEKYLQS
ncbi:MAG: shikimate dehydrogenase [Oscillospiraceae bacterium]|nr:shikimate dehydrogenase [Oscillospiraceae bacterium]